MHQLNKYSWFLIVIYIAVVLIMNLGSLAMSLESLYITSPLIISVILWSEKTTFLINKTAYTTTKIESFKRDLFLISFSFISGELLSFLFQYNNIDARGWWPLALYFISLYGIIFAFIFSLFAVALKNHKKYTFIFFFLIFMSIPICSYLAYTMPFSVFAKNVFFYEHTGLLIGVHILLCIGNRILLFFLTRRRTTC